MVLSLPLSTSLKGGRRAGMCLFFFFWTTRAVVPSVGVTGSEGGRYRGLGLGGSGVSVMVFRLQGSQG